VKLYLSSYGLGNKPETLQHLVGSNKHVAVICNAQDLADDEKRAERVERAFDEMTSLGFTAEELDLRDYFQDNEKLKKDITKFGLVWIRGGNVFVLRRAAKQSGFDRIIEPLVVNEEIVYAGFSAGSCLATPSLHGIELVDDKDAVPEGYDKAVVWSGLNFVGRSIAPHYRSDHYESEAIEKTVEYFEEHNINFWALRDGEAIVVQGDKLQVIG
jgi:dipeptidase E